MKQLLTAPARHLLPPRFRQATQRALRRLWSVRLGARLSIAEFERILRLDLGVNPGSTVLVHCSFGRLKAAFSCEEAVQLLKGIVGEGGNILMPCYPGNGEEWLASGRVFDARTTPYVTGMLAQTFARSSAVAVSSHPIKAVAAWGKDRDFLIGEHHLSRTPYDARSPYAKLLHRGGGLVVGLGTAKMSFFHCCEDAVPEYAGRLYTEHPVKGRCRMADGQVIDVPTFVHRTAVLSAMPSSLEFLTRSGCPGYSVFSRRGRLFYRGDVRQIYDHVRQVVSRPPSDQSRRVTSR